MTTIYRCPRCQQTITLHITPKTPPTCACHPRRQPTTMYAEGGGDAA